jgi:hypothetical protein
VASIRVLEVVVDRSRSIFPADLPERPHKTPKLRFTKRWSQKLTASKSRRNQSTDNYCPQSVSEKYGATVVENTAPFTNDVTSHHVRTRCVSTSVAEFPSNDNPTALWSHGIGPRLRQAVSSPKIHKLNNSENTSSISPEYAIPPSIEHDPLQSLYSIYRKPLAPDPDTYVRDQLEERFQRLRLPQNGKLQPRPRVPATLSLSLQHTPSSSAASSIPLAATGASHILEAMSASNIMPAQVQSLKHDRPHNSVTLASRTRSELFNTSKNQIAVSYCNGAEGMHPMVRRFHHPVGRRTHTNKRALSPPYRPNSAQRRLRRRIRGSCDSSDTLSEGDLAPTSSQDVSYPTLPVGSVDDEREHHALPMENIGTRFLDSKDASLLQEEIDRRFAQRLQNEEDRVYQREQSLHAQMQASERHPYASPPARRKELHRYGFGESTAPNHHGTRDDPIDLDIESDLDSDDSDSVIFMSTANVGRPFSHDADLMDLDEDDWGSTDNKVYLHHVDGDANLAQRLHEEEEEEEERSRQAAKSTRDCVVCGEDQHISELHALADCEHIPQTCGNCYAQWVAAQLEGSGWREAKCPESKCKIKLSYYEIQQVVTQDIFLQYDTFITRAAISEDRKYICRKRTAGEANIWK